MNPEHGDLTQSEEAEQVVKLTEPSKIAAYSSAGLCDKLVDIHLPENLDWLYKLSIVAKKVEKVDVNDDLLRESSFHTQAAEAALKVYLKLESTGESILRPSDCYAEMVKSDTHMEKVKGWVLAEKRKIEEAEERRKDRVNKKLCKEVQVQKMKERAKQEKQEIEFVNKWRKQRDLAFHDDVAKSFQNSNKKRLGGDRSGGKATFSGKVKGPNNKRKLRDAKFGFGGRKGLKKQNTAETTNDLRGFH